MNTTTNPKHLLYEHVSGYELFELRSFESLADESYMDYLVLTQVVKHISTLPFQDANDAVTHIATNNTGKPQILPDFVNFLSLNNVTVLYADKQYKHLLEPLGIEYKSAPEIMRGVRRNIHKFTGKPLDIQLLRSVSHMLSREAIRYNMEREDNLVISVGFECDEIEAEIKTLSARMSCLVDWAVPYLKKKVTGDGYNTELSNAIESEIIRQGAGEEPKPTESLLDELKMIKNVSLEDLSYIKSINETIIEKRRLLLELKSYLSDKMKIVAPNLSTILGDQLAYKLIHKAGGLTSLALMPASTLQLLGAEKSLFRSLKMRSKTPKYGMLREYVKKKDGRGRMCRFVATKCSLAARIDAFSKERVATYGKELKKMIDKRMSMGAYGKVTERTEDLFNRVCKMNESKSDAMKTSTDLKSGPKDKPAEIPSETKQSNKKGMEARSRPTGTSVEPSKKQKSVQGTATKGEIPCNASLKKKSPYEMTKSAKNKVVEKDSAQKKVRRSKK